MNQNQNQNQNKSPQTQPFWQQGDVLIFRIAALPAGAVRESVHSQTQIVLARGEATGHAHTLEAEEGVQLYTLEQILYLVADHEVTITHQEHGPVALPAGTYRVDIVQEYDYVEHESRKVRD